MKFNFKNNYHVIKKIYQSATFAILLSVVFFAYDLHLNTKESQELVENLEKIQGSLSTRYLGLFPEYIDNINDLLSDAIEHQDLSTGRDSIIIFEDVIYYGINSDAMGFRVMMENILTLSNNGCHITIAYYDIDSRPFKQMIRDKLISFENQALYRDDLNSYRARLRKLRNRIDSMTDNFHEELNDDKITKLINEHFDNYISAHSPKEQIPSIIRNIRDYSYVDSTLLQHYYELSISSNKHYYLKMLDKLQQTLPTNAEAKDDTSLIVNNLCAELDEIKRKYADKSLDNISYSDFYNMYKDFTLTISSVLDKQHNIELLPLQENMMMCCWMSSIQNNNKAIFAFPSKYSTDEIGFISQDMAIIDYIQTMLNGVKTEKRSTKTEQIN